MSEILSRQYKSMFSVPSMDIRDMDLEHLRSKTFSTLHNIEVTTSMIEQAIKDIPNDASPGPNGIGPLFLKNGGLFVYEALEDILKQSLSESYIPQIMKDIWITPLWKGGPKTDPAEYRPLAMSSHLIKTLERVVRKQLVEYLEDYSLLEICQHGSRAGRSTLTQLMSQHTKLLESLKDGSNLELLYLDFSKAFDKVSHPILLERMAELGIGGNLLEWIRAFLSDRYQRIRVGQKLSDKTYVLSGVPQGSVLGPVLFLIFISTLGDNIPDKDHLFKYVDDTKYYGKVKNDEDICNFQERLNTLYNWADTNEMKWNSLKFQLLRMGPDEGLVEDSLIFSPNYQDIIGQSELVKDLGILIDAEMTYKNQRDKAILKANQKSGWVSRECSTIDAYIYGK